MKLYQLVEQTNWQSVWHKYMMLYPSRFESEEVIFRAYMELKSKSPQYISTVLLFTTKPGKPKVEVNVLGQLPNNEFDYALEFNSPEEWLGMEIDTQTLTNFSQLDIIAHCLNEMVTANITPPLATRVKKGKFDYA